MTVSPSVTCPSPASATRASRRTSRMVVLRILDSGRLIVLAFAFSLLRHYRNRPDGKSSGTRPAHLFPTLNVDGRALRVRTGASVWVIVSCVNVEGDESDEEQYARQEAAR